MTGHYFEPAPASRSVPRTITVALPDLTLDLHTDRGVFSADRVDPGTKLLLSEAPPPPGGGTLLDLGCGYGVIAVVQATRSPAARVWAVDVNDRARALAARNSASLGNVTVATPADVPPALTFDALYSNPPIRIGQQALHQLLRDWLPRATVSYLVVHKNLGSDSLARWMQSEGWSVERRVSRLGYRVLEVRPGGTQR